MAENKSDLSRAFSEDGALKTHVGGQALLEGIMMRGKLNWAVAVREPDGNIYLEEHDLASGRKKNGWMYWPMVRGCRAMVESLVIGYKALEIATMHAFVDEEEEGEQTPKQHEAAQGVKAAEAGDSVREGEGASPADKPFSWKDDFGRPDTVIDALGAQRSLDPVAQPVAGDASSCHPGRGAQAEVEGSPAGQPGGCDEGHSRASGRPTGDPSTTPPDGGSAQDDNVRACSGAAQDDGLGDCGSARDDNSDSSEGGGMGQGVIAFSMVLGLVMGIVLFIVAPAFLTNLIVGEYDSNTLAWNIVDGLLRVVVFVFYIWLIGRMSDIKRMFGYHGAEHKTIHCYEHGLPLTPENARSFPRLHVRCGTAFLIMVMIIAILVYTIVPLNALIEAWGVPDGAPKLALVILVRIVLMPVIAGLSYEITVKWAGSHPDNPLVKVVLWPGMQMQYLTTNEPDDGMLECAIAAMQKVLEREEAEAKSESEAGATASA